VSAKRRKNTRPTARARKRARVDRAGLEALKEAAQSALIYAIMGDAGKCSDAIGAICEMGPRAIHAALSGWAGLAHHVFEKEQGPAGPGDFWYVEAEDTRTGEIVSIDEMNNPAARDAVRLVSCIGNNDHATIAAIVKTACADEETLAELMVQSVTLAASLAKYQAKKDGRLP
jgi:hypothetical protein